MCVFVTIFVASEEAMMASRSFMTSVVVGKDIVPRIGLNQLEILRQDIMTTIKKSRFSKVGLSKLKLFYLTEYASY
jgi:hypothetical protein